jgi:hypothetical protein
LVEFLKNELERCKVALTEADPGTETYRSALNALNELNYMLERELRLFPVFDVDSVPPADIEKGEEAPVVAKPVKEEAPAPSAPKLKKEDVRAALADARLKGVDVSKLIADLGAANLSGVDPDDYPKLMDALAAELEGK